MELWIRSQDKWELHKVEHIRIEMEESYFNIMTGINLVGTYKTKERALEVLDDIQNKLKSIFLMKSKDAEYDKYILDAKRYLEELNDICLVTGDKCFDLKPINVGVYVYEMPKE